jgi:hypothetical protein
MVLYVVDKRTGRTVEVFSYTSDDWAMVGPPGDKLHTEFVPFNVLDPSPRHKARLTRMRPRWA